MGRMATAFPNAMRSTVPDLFDNMTAWLLDQALGGDTITSFAHRFGT
ncbi:MAG: hypothetical protein ABJR46_00250 [Tateyamaria sp.]